MGKITGFLEYNRELPATLDKLQRVQNFEEFYLDFDEEKLNRQAARCMDCGVPFCQSGCPLGNQIPDFNDAVYQGNWKEAIDILQSTNNFPEFTGRICPAPCEASCVLSINKPPVAIELIEKTIAEEAFSKGYIEARPPKFRTSKKAAVVGSGPAGLAAAAQLNKAGHSVTVFERDDKIGGLLRYGIPDFKLEKWVIDRRLSLLEEEGVVFKTNTNVGVDFPVEELMNQFDAIILCGGSTIPRDMPLPGRQLNGIHFAMDFLSRQNRKVSGQNINLEDDILATGKDVVVIGGGDTGSDCIGTSNRQNAKSITQFELLWKPPTSRMPDNPWPEWPLVLRTSSSQEEGCERSWAILSKEFIDYGDGNLSGIKVVDVEWQKTYENRYNYVEVKDSERIIPCDLVLIAIGYLHPQKEGLFSQLGIDLDFAGNVKTFNYQTNKPKVFSAGDMKRGQSLVVWAISEGREAARSADEFLMGKSFLETVN